MKYRVIIADDEPKIIQLIRQLGHWEELEIEIVDECCNGAQAFESILKHHPDFVLSDIKMPVYDGIELIRRVREAKLDPFFVLLSGYRHFEYARSAVQLNVMDYLLKPIDEQQLNETLKKVCVRIDQRKTFSEFRADQNRKDMERFWQKLIYGDLDAEDPAFVSEEAFNREYHTEFSEGCYQVLCVFTNLSAILGERDTVSSGRVDAHIQESFQGIAKVCHLSTYMGYILILNFEESRKNDVRQAVQALYYKIRDLRETYGDIRLNIGCSRIRHALSEIPKAFHEAHSAEWGRLVLARNGVLEYDQVSGLTRFSTVELFTEAELRTMTECIRYLRKEELSDLFEKFYHRAGYLKNRNPGDMMNSFFMIQSRLLECFENDALRRRMEEDSYYAYLNARNFPQVMQNFYLMCQNYIEEEQGKLKEKKSKPIQMAVHFVKENYAGQISLEDAAEAGNVSAAYLSRLFKNELQIGFNEFLTQIRLEESEKLLAETNLSVREIAARVGYLDEKYYSKLFKKNTGIKPTDYRRIYS